MGGTPLRRNTFRAARVEVLWWLPYGGIEAADGKYEGSSDDKDDILGPTDDGRKLSED